DYITNIKQQLDIVIWKSFNITNQKQVTSILDCKADYLVFDSNIAGSGVTADWSINLDCIADKLILAGGININNISSAIKLFNPRVIDISTGVEVNGIKDEYKINEIINYIRRDYNL
ncbi:MAG: hypothetical protein RSD85_03135, partial [Erysipelotrichaceae bacterium]